MSFMNEIVQVFQLKEVYFLSTCNKKLWYFVNFFYVFFLEYLKNISYIILKKI